jgi:hypothetical protein
MIIIIEIKTKCEKDLKTFTPFPKVYSSWGYMVHKVYLIFDLFKLNLTIQKFSLVFLSFSKITIVYLN